MEVFSCRNEVRGKGKTDLKTGVEGVRTCSFIIYVFVTFRLPLCREASSHVLDAIVCLHTGTFWYSAPEEGQELDPREALSGFPMFAVLLKEDTFYEYLQLTPKERANKWRIKRDQLDMITERTWERHSWSQDSLSARNFTLNEYWNNFVHQLQLDRFEINTHANTQPKSVFSFALTVMDKMLAWNWTGKGQDPDLPNACGSTQKQYCAINACGQEW